ncbi:unnamed protein product [Macrosiphum euphorbiae]|uniref:Uncharacterized protein n=1 Tax=Macrosiphum euphorbiae TaxID=13131 RepID=A0AAV0XTZ1_9HEMI|nr:unnamed protein product [Macrosiphum euphorbiae]
MTAHNDGDRRKTGKPTTERREFQNIEGEFTRHETRGRLANQPGREDHERVFETGGQQSRVEKTTNAASGPSANNVFFLP